MIEVLSTSIGVHEHDAGDPTFSYIERDSRALQRVYDTNSLALNLAAWGRHTPCEAHGP